MKTTLLKSIVLIAVFVLVGTTKLYSQNPNNKGYLSYFGNDSTNINMTHVPCQSGDVMYNLSGVIYNHDTIRINGNLYMYRVPQNNKTPDDRRIDYYFPRYDTLFLREEQETGRLYRYYRDYFGMGEAEKLLCDMTLEVGDKFVMPDHFCLGEDTVTVFQVSYTSGRKIIELVGYMTDYTFVEGLFPLDFPLWQEPIRSGEYGSADWSELLCVHKDGEQVYINSEYGCYGHNPWLVDETEEESFSLYPNIIHKSGIITINSSSGVVGVSIIDMLGKTEIIEANRLNDNTWNINLSADSKHGVYFIAVQTENGFKYEKVFVCN